MATLDKVLVVDDNEDYLEFLQIRLAEFYNVLGARSGYEAIELVNENPDIVAIIMDIRMSGKDGIETAKEVHSILPKASIIMHTAHAGDYSEEVIEDAVHPFDYIIKEKSLQRLERAIRNGVEACKLKSKCSILQSDSKGKHGLIGASLAMQSLYRLIEKYAASDCSILITGETGVGKSLIAEVIHKLSDRKDKEFRAFNCNLGLKELIQDKLFGHMKGAFTEATTDKNGIVQEVEGGTLFLDEIADLEKDIQGKLLDFIQDLIYEPVGWTGRPYKANIRLIFGTNKCLLRMIENQEYRHDLFSRFDKARIEVPPLREHREDIPLLVDYFARDLIETKNYPHKEFSNCAIAEYMASNFWDNIRGLKNSIERVMINSDNDIIFRDDVLRDLNLPVEPEILSYDEQMARSEKQYLMQILRITNGDIAKACELSGLAKATIHKKINLLGIDLGAFRK